MKHVAVVGAGIAGLAATLAAVRHGARVTVFGSSGATDLCGAGWTLLPATSGDPTRDALLSALPAPHPLRRARGAQEALGEAHRALFTALEPLYRPLGAPGAHLLATSFGRERRCASAQTPALDLASLPPGAVVAVAGLPGLRDFDARFVAASLGERAAARGETRRFVAIDVEFLRRRGDTLHFAHEIAARLDDERVLDRLALALRRALAATSVDAVLTPPLLGLARLDVASRLGRAIGLPVGEAHDEHAGVASLRLRRALDRALREAGATRRPELVVRLDGNELVLAEGERVAAEAIVLATGRSVGGGVASGAEVYPLSGAPYAGLSPRERGLRVDHDLRPLDAQGAPCAEHLFAAGDLLADVGPLALGVAATTGWLAGANAARAGA